MEIGIYTFAERTPDPVTGATIGEGQRLRDLLEQAELADAVGLDVYGVGEHHRPDFVASAPAVVLAAIAARTTRIRLTSAVTVLSSDDPVRVYQQFSTLDLLSHGRAEIMAGRGSFTESFPLFGHSLDDYHSLFAEKLELLLRIRDEERLTWRGRHRAPLADVTVYPRAEQSPLPVWVAVGGTPQSVARAAALGLPMALAIIGGELARFQPFAKLYRDRLAHAGRDPMSLPLGINTHGYVAETSAEAAADFYPSYATVMTQIGRERGWPPTTRAQFEAQRAPGGALAVGSPQEMIDKLLYQHELFGNQRALIQLSVGSIPQAKMLRAIELLGTVVAPAVREAVGRRAGGGKG
jgi:probable LLM family oxidoreductase